MEKHIEAREVREIAGGCWLDLLGVLAPVLEPALNCVGRHVPCPVHGGSDGFRLFRDADLTGGGVCNTCGTFPDGFALLMWVNRWSFPEALRSVAQALGLADDCCPASRGIPNPRPRPTERDRESVIDTLDRVRQRSLDPTDRPAAPLRTYLSRRGLSGARLDGGAELIGRFPAMVALVTWADGMPLTVHRTYLTADGRKAPVAEPKKLMGYPGHRLVGGATRRDLVGRGVGGSGLFGRGRGGGADLARAPAQERDLGGGASATGAHPCRCEGNRLGGRLVRSAGTRGCLSQPKADRCTWGHAG
jgi:putative DNA primase/helicase